ncbi:myelin-associated glycoprotein [Hoplias malabaricus]|uniref:myelin-associated glycoprotein n=1 Tax=Hoplias malabaricus TaxID=27720 RepID=UPI003462DAA7
MDRSHLQIRCFWTSVIISGVFAGDWVVRVPEGPVHAHLGSSVTVPCSYDFPEDSENGKPHKVLSEMWCRNQSFCITPTYVYHSDGIFPDPEYQGRVKYLGSTGSKKCSIRITDLKTTDSGVYVFRFITDHPVKKLPGQRGFTLQFSDGNSVSYTGIVLGVILTLIAIVATALLIRRRKHAKSLRTNADGTL